MTYPGSDKSMWFQDDPGLGGAAMRTNCGVIHTTEGRTLPGYSDGKNAPNYTLLPDFDINRLKPFQHFPDNRSSRALVNAPGGVETNTLNALQVELVGTCDPATAAAWRRAGITRFIYWPEAPEWALRDLAKFMAWHARHTGIPLAGPRDERWVAYPESFGPGGQRFTFKEWQNFTGWCGHQHVPENVHGDPGNIPFEKVLGLAKNIIAKPPAPKATPRWDKVYELARDIRHDFPDLADAATVMQIASRNSTKY